jgi:tetrapyrrole methylase family protein/MazG family protein
MPGRITIVGLGPGDPSQRTTRTQAILDEASAIILRTGIHPGIEDLLADPRVTTCDDLYQSHSTFDKVYTAVADLVIQVAESSDVVFAVPGHPLFGEQSVRRILDLAPDRQIDVDVQPSVSALDTVASTLSIDPLADELQIIDAETLDSIWAHEPFSGGWLVIDPTRPCLVGQVYSQQIASHVKLTLARIYPEDHRVIVVKASGIPGEEAVTECRLFELDHQAVDHLTSVLVPPLDELETYRTAEAVQRLVAHLRSPEGCPWDRKQNHETLLAAVIEEAHEVVDAIMEVDPDHLAEELGDLFLVIAMHAQIADEAGDFSLEDVYQHIATKLIRRHPHVFEEIEVSTADEVVATWEGIKKAERVKAGIADVDQHPVDRLPKSMPALTRVATLLQKGRDAQTPGSPDRDQLAADLFTAIEALVAAGIDPENALLDVARERIDSGLVGVDSHADNQDSKAF